MGNRIISASLDDATYQIWKTIDRRSAWLRRMLAAHALQEGIEFRNHFGHPHETWGFSKGDARCNPISLCPLCWNILQRDYYEKVRNRETSKKDIKAALEWRERADLL